MAKFIGIRVTAPNKNVGDPIKTYDLQLQSTEGSLIEQDLGSGESSIDFPHNSIGSIPLVLTSRIDGNGKRHALIAENIDSKYVLVSPTLKFFRIFTNNQTLP